MNKSRSAFSLFECCIVMAIAALILWILSTTTSLAQMYFLSGQLSTAVQGAVVIAAEFEQDLRQAVRDPETGASIVLSGSGSTSIAFYRGIMPAGRRDLLLAPVRWTLRSDPSTGAGYLVRTCYDHERQGWDTREFRWATVPAPDSSTASGGRAFRVIEGQGCPLVTIQVTVLSRAKRLENVPGAAQDAACAQVAVAVPYLTDEAARLVRPLKKISQLPPG